MDAADFEPMRVALLAERARLLDEIGEAIVAPGQMTYGSQAAAASQVFAQQRDLALRDRAEPAARARRRGARAVRRRHLRAVRPLRPADRRRIVSRPCPGRPAASTASASPRRSDDAMTDRTRTRPLVTIDDIRAAAERLRGVIVATPLVAFGPARGPAIPQGRVAPADRRVQDPRRVRRDRLAAGRGPRPRGHLRIRRATTPRASPARPGCWERRRSSSCRRTRRRSSATGSPPTAPRS